MTLFDERERAAWGGLLRTYALLDRAIEADLREHDGITHVEFEVLLRLWSARNRRRRIQDLAADSVLTRSGTSRLVDRLAKAGLVARESAPEDGRGSYAALTDQGQATFEQLAPRHVAQVRELFLARLSEDEVTTLIGIWSKVAPA
jgi:DNA-binding MarR family transcriptional regulator